jgi:hypothetical protein
VSRSWRALLPLSLALVLVGLVAPGASVATHMVPTPLKYYWDPDNNGAPGPEPVLDPSGGFWESLRYARLDGALAEWRTETQFDPTRSTSSSVKVYVDGRLGPCISDWTPSGGTIIAVVCRDQVAGINPSTGFQTYWKITDLDLFFNMEVADSPNWWIGSTLTTDPGRLDFQGVATHEIGHMIRLIDVYDSTSCTRTAADQMTMCGEIRADGRLDTWRSRSLHTHDISSANAVY